MDRSQVCRPPRHDCLALRTTLSLWLVLMTAVGCQMSLPFARNEYGSPLPDNAGVEEIVRRVNANTERLQAWRSSDLRISGRSLPVHLTGNIAVERPRNFRLKAGALGMTEEADFGSNADWFWFWVRRGEPNAVVRARHDDMENSEVVRQAIPFQPEWLIEALGVVPLDPKQVTRLEPGETHQTVNLISELLSPSGQPVQKVVRVDVRHGVVLGHYLYDANRRLIAKADLDKHELDRAKGIIMPHLISLEWPQAGLQISLELGQIEINPMTMSASTWQVPNKEPNYPSWDIGARSRRPRDNGSRFGRLRPGMAEPSAPADFDNPGVNHASVNPSDFNASPPDTTGRASLNSDGGSLWTKPIESSQPDPDPRSSQLSPRDFAPSQTVPALPRASRPTPTTPNGDPFAADSAWPNSQSNSQSNPQSSPQSNPQSNSQPAQPGQASNGDVFETVPH